MLPFVNRSVVLVRPTEKHLQWLRATDVSFTDDLLKDFYEETAYLMEELETGTEDEIQGFMMRHWQDVAKEQFSQWYDVPEEWPKLKSFNEFKEYFAYRAVEPLFDVLKGLIEKD